MKENPLGRDTDYPERYDRELLYPVERAAGRSFASGDALPFHGVDLWTAWELTWLDPGGRPVAAVLRFEVPADSPWLVESKSVKLYLDSFSMTRFDSAAAVRERIEEDLSRAAGARVRVRVTTAGESHMDDIAGLPGHCIDDEALVEPSFEPRAALLRVGGETVGEALHTHLLRSLCPVTGQPDIGSLLVDYRGPRIDRAALLAYVVGFRRHEGFHEACVERMFMDIRARCRPERLTVYARYCRRGGIDINPFRTNTDAKAPNLRLWRQ